MKKSEMDFIYNVKCPICGSKPSYQATSIRPNGGISTFTQMSCGHEDLEKIIEKRHSEVLGFLQKKQSVHLSQSPKNDPETNIDGGAFQVPVE
ncbi:MULTISPECIES: hypothetical protein [Flavobacterium]|uniref:hypothetical protein n=1 Tax=Flavobacterium TaxID=237 RepID=UPI000F4DB073|nr:MULTISPECIES: hypothetical protein [Flavobacterium]